MNVDSNIIIAYLDGDKSVIDILSNWKNEGKFLFISAIVETEVLSFSKWNEEERINTEQFLTDNFIFVPFDRHISHVAATIRRDVKLKFPDAAIAATSIFTNTPLITRNVRDFKKVSNISLIEI